VYGALDVTPFTFTDATLTTDTPMTAVHLQELRTACNALSTMRTMTASFYHLDAVGSVRAVTGADGAVVRRHDYGPFGEEIAPVGGTDGRRFTGKERDTETGTHRPRPRGDGAGDNIRRVVRHSGKECTDAEASQLSIAK
jgi:hypothetical protein